MNKAMAEDEVVRFRLTDGYRDAGGAIHRDGLLRPSRVVDELLALRDFRVHVWPERILDVILPRVVLELGSLGRPDAGVVQALSLRDRAQLESLYREVNGYAS